MNAPLTTRHFFVFLEIFDTEGGIQSYVKDVLKAYEAIVQQAIEQGQPAWQAEIFVLRDGQQGGNRFSSPYLKFHYCKVARSPMAGRIKLVLTLALRLWQQRPQQVFAGHVNVAPLVQQLCQLRSIPYTVLTYGKEVWEPLPARACRALQQANAIWTISRYSRDQACQANPFSPQHIKLLPCAINGEIFTPGVKDPDLIQRYGLANSQVLMTVARLWSGDIYKGVDVTIRALPEILKAFPNVKYLVIGRGDDQPRLAQLAKDLAVSDRVVFAGFVPTTDLVAHYRLADAYVMPSQEGFGIVYLEAMACGIPVLSGDADGSADPLQDGALGWRVPHRDPQAVAAACIEILKELSLPAAERDRRCHGVWLRQQALALFGTAALTQQLRQLLGSD